MEIYYIYYVSDFCFDHPDVPKLSEKLQELSKIQIKQQVGMTLVKGISTHTSSPNKGEKNATLN